MLNLVIVEGDGAVNNIRQRLAREPIVEVDDENHRPVAGAVVVFMLPSTGAGGTFANGSKTLTVITDSQGRAVARGFTPNNIKGAFQIRVTASHNGQTASITISQTNAILTAAGTAAGSAISGKLIAVLVAVGAAAAAGGAYYATHSSNNTPAVTGPTSTTIAAGAGTVGPPR
jgi:hypothetical protein